jgi:hypothetical protein
MQTYERDRYVQSNYPLNVELIKKRKILETSIITDTEFIKINNLHT